MIDWGADAVIGNHPHVIQPCEWIEASDGRKGFVLYACGNFISTQRGTGNTRVAFTTNFVSSIVNIVFNYLLIKGHLGFPQLGVQGAAIATVLGTIVGFLMSLYSLTKTDSYIQLSYIFRNKLLAARSIAHSIFSLGSTVAAEEFLMRIGI